MSGRSTGDTERTGTLQLYADCPECGEPVGVWCDCAVCGWYDPGTWADSLEEER